MSQCQIFRRTKTEPSNREHQIIHFIFLWNKEKAYVFYSNKEIGIPHHLGGNPSTSNSVVLVKAWWLNWPGSFRLPDYNVSIFLHSYDHMIVQ